MKQKDQQNEMIDRCGVGGWMDDMVIHASGNVAAVAHHAEMLAC